MTKHIYWIRSLELNKDAKHSNGFYKCIISRDSLEIFDEFSSLTRIPIHEISRISLDIEILFTAYNFFVMITTKEDSKYRLEVINPLYPGVRTNINFKESKSLVQLIKHLMKRKEPASEANPYLRNRFKKMDITDSQDLLLPPDKFYERYIRKEHQLNKILAILIPGLIVLFGLLFNFLNNN